MGGVQLEDQNRIRAEDLCLVWFLRPKTAKLCQYRWWRWWFQLCRKLGWLPLAHLRVLHIPGHLDPRAERDLARRMAVLQSRLQAAPSTPPEFLPGRGFTFLPSPPPEEPGEDHEAPRSPVLGLLLFDSPLVPPGYRLRAPRTPDFVFSWVLCSYRPKRPVNEILKISGFYGCIAIGFEAFYGFRALGFQGFWALGFWGFRVLEL